MIGMSVELNKFGGLLERKLPGNQIVELIDLRFDELAGQPQRGLILLTRPCRNRNLIKPHA